MTKKIPHCVGISKSFSPDVESPSSTFYCIDFISGPPAQYPPLFVGGLCLAPSLSPSAGIGINHTHQLTVLSKTVTG